MTFLQRINRTSPKCCRLLARKSNGRRPMSNRDIAEASGLARSTIDKLSKLDTWDKVTMATAEAFSRACGVDLLRPSMRRDKRLVSSGKMAFVRKSSPAQRRMFQRILSDLGVASTTNVGGPSLSSTGNLPEEFDLRAGYLIPASSTRGAFPRSGRQPPGIHGTP